MNKMLVRSPEAEEGKMRLSDMSAEPSSQVQHHGASPKSRWRVVTSLATAFAPLLLTFAAATITIEHDRSSIVLAVSSLALAGVAFTVLNRRIVRALDDKDHTVLTVRYPSDVTRRIQVDPKDVESVKEMYRVMGSSATLENVSIDCEAGRKDQRKTVK